MHAARNLTHPGPGAFAFNVSVFDIHKPFLSGVDFGSRSSFFLSLGLLQDDCVLPTGLLLNLYDLFRW
jgi:hypothetical protein